MNLLAGSKINMRVRTAPLRIRDSVKRFLPVGALAFLTLLTPACNFVWETDDRQRFDLGVDPIVSPWADSPVYGETIGSVAYFQGMKSIAVRGYGVVVGLGENGSRDCPDQIYKQLIDRLRKRHDFESPIVGEPSLSPERMLRSRDTAVVLVRGEIPPSAPAGTRFDISVSALPGTRTKSLRGGRLYTTELQMFRITGPSSTLAGRTLAEGRGPVFTNPFTGDDVATQADPRFGTVLGGGIVKEDRRLRLVLIEPSYATARRVQDRINSQFGEDYDIAEATSPSYVELTIPPYFRRDVGHFLSLVRALYMTQDSTFEAQRVRALREQLARPDAPHGDIALCFEGIGRESLAVLDELYTDERPYVNFHAAVAGIRLGDYLAAHTLAMHAEDPQSYFRFQAIRALGTAAGMGKAATTLRDLLEDEDPRVRVAAYEALLDRGDFATVSIPVGEDNFVLDYVPYGNDRFVYAKRSGRQRLALFGQNLHCVTPLFYRAPDGAITLVGNPDADHLTVTRVTPDGSVSPPLHAPTDLAELLRFLGRAPTPRGSEVLGVGLDYAAVVRTLYYLCDAGHVNARFMLEQPNTLELFGPGLPPERPETEFAAGLPDSDDRVAEDEPQFLVADNKEENH
jgi:flagellar basal body P-ring protein FlgI